MSGYRALCGPVVLVYQYTPSGGFTTQAACQIATYEAVRMALNIRDVHHPHARALPNGISSDRLL